MKELKSDIEAVNPKWANIAQLLFHNAEWFSNRIVFQSNINEKYVGISWKNFFNNILNIAFNLRKNGFTTGDKIVIISPNRLEMLELQLAVMASGGIAVPVFAYFIQETLEMLIKHADAKFLAVAGNKQLSRVNPDLSLKKIFVFDNINFSNYKNLHGLVSFNELLTERNDGNFSLRINDSPDEICLNMYTSGTMGVPKCVQLTHKNILSQQAALGLLWKIDENDRFLSYLPWHHSFGGIFELFAVLYNGAALSLEHSYGKDAMVIMENWRQVKPTVFFSVPKVYQALVDLTKESKELENLFFHPELKFIFTAAASLPEKLSVEFEKRNIPVLEGWGLTETSPCCTVTDPLIKRERGVVGKPIPGVNIRLSDEGEILVKGPNVMAGYYKNDAANKEAFTDDGWYCTGDLGELTVSGLKLIARKDRIFKLSNGEKINPSELELVIQDKCHYVSFALVEGSGRDYTVALLFPNKKLLDTPNYKKLPFKGCFCPRNLNEFAKCLHGCMNDSNCSISQKFSKIKAVALIDDELSVEKGTLTSSMKVAPKNVGKMYKAELECLYGEKENFKEKVYVIELEDKVLAK